MEIDPERFLDDGYVIRRNVIPPDRLGELRVQRFALLDAKLHTETERFVPGFQGGPSRHRFEHMPPNFEVDDFTASWKQTA